MRTNEILAAVLLSPGLASAEILDKEVMPWEMGRIAATLVVASICGLLTLWSRSRSAAKHGQSALITALFLAGAWGAFLGLDDFYDARFDSLLRIELGPLARVYSAVLVTEVVGPLLVIISLMGFTRRRMKKQIV